MIEDVTADVEDAHRPGKAGAELVDEAGDEGVALELVEVEDAGEVGGGPEQTGGCGTGEG
jgi:hypothetical protein